MNQRYLMSSAQKRIYTIEQMKENSVTYNVPMVFEVEAIIDIERLGKAFYMLCQRHEVFRSHFIVEDDKFMQVVEEHVTSELQYLSGHREHLDKVIEEFVQPFDLGRAPLIRLGLLHNSDNTSLILIDVHHIIFDGGSVHALLTDLRDLYAGLELKPLPIQYKDFAAWQNSYINEEHKQYWISEHKERLECAEIPTDYPREKQLISEGGYFEQYLSEKIVKKIEKLCIETCTTPVMMYMSGFMGFLAGYSRDREVVIGTPAEGRNHSDAQDMIGMFVNTLAIRGKFETNMTFRDSLLYVREKCLSAYENQDYSFEDLLDNLDIQHSSNRNPLFDIMFSYEVAGDVPLCFDGKVANILSIKTNIAKFDITLTVIEEKNSVRLNWEYNQKLYKENTIKCLNDHFVVFLENCICNPENELEKISYINEEEQQKILYVFNNKLGESGLKLPIETFEEHVENNPLHKAIIFGEDSLTYAELNEKANFIGAQLREKGIKNNDVVAILTERSMGMICGILGIMKAGATYLPIDPHCPIERINFILEDSNTKIVLVNQKYSHLLRNKEVILINLQNNKEENLNIKISPEDVAYIIYTSGTTGKPKGVLIKHKSLANLMSWQKKEADINHKSVVLQKSTYVFDASVWEIFIALLSGASLQLLSEDENNDFNTLLDIFEGKNVTHTLMIPTVFEALLDYMEESGRNNALSFLCRIYLGAEVVSKELIEKYCRVTQRDKSALRNLYGPTEGTVCATYCNLSDYDGREQVPIGKPIANVMTFIMEGKQICGIGVPGEICIGGIGLAKGYVNNKELTEEKFCVFDTLSSITLYRTGDIGRWREDGTIEYLGRIDDQIKIRGFRVEVGEIESSLKQYQGVKNAVVILRKEKNNYLCAYITGEQQINTNELLNHLRDKLPDYMIPSFVIQVEAFPTTVNGKLDKKALPKPVRNDSSANESLNEAEQLIAEIFETVLSVKNVRKTDSFFELGGDSIKAIRVVSKLREIGYKVTVRQVMEKALITDIASVISVETSGEISQGEVIGIVEKTPIQKYFYESNLAEPNHFNQSVVFKSKNSIDSSALIKACNAIVEHHDLLRMVVKNEQQIIQSCRDAKMVDYKYFDIRQTDLNNLEYEISLKSDYAQKDINLKNGPLVKVLQFQLYENSYVVIIIHHLVVDGVSWRILEEDLNTAYEQATKHFEIELPAKTTSFSTWSNELKKYRKSEEINGQTKYWEKINKQLDLGRFVIRKNDPIDLSVINTKLNNKLTSELLCECGSTYKTEVKDLLLTALCRSICRIYNTKNLAVNLEGHGREQISDEIYIDRTVGWFTTLYPAFLHITYSSIRQDIRDIKEQVRRIPDNGIGYGILSTYDSIIERKEADVTFNYLGEFDLQIKEDVEFTIANLSIDNDISKKNIFGSPLSINCAVVSGYMEIDIFYHNPLVTTEEATTIQKYFCQELEGIIDHCKEAQQEQTASDVGEYEWSDEEFRAVKARFEKNNNSIHRVIPLTPMQEGILYHRTLNKDSTSYVVQCGYEINGKFSEERLKNALKILAERHIALRIAIVSDGVNVPRQVVLSNRTIEYRSMEIIGGEEAYMAFLRDDVKRGFDLEKDPLLRISVINLSKKDVKVVFCFHHIIIDGWCFSILMKELEEIYKSSCKTVHKFENRISDKKNGYEEFARSLFKKNKRKALVYWKQLLKEYEGQASVESLNKPKVGDEEIGTITSNLSKEEGQALKELSRKLRVTNSTIIELAWGLVLQLYNNTDDVVFAKIVSGRNGDLDNIENEIGLFINAITVRVKTEDMDTTETLLKKLQMQANESSEYDYAPLADVQAQTPQGAGLIHTILAYENYQMENIDKDSLFVAKEYREQTNYEISISATYLDTLHLKLMYDKRIYSHLDAHFILKRMVQVLQTIIKNPTNNIKMIEVIDKNEMEKIIYKFNDNKFTYDTQNTVIDFFHKQVEQHPNQVAVSCGEEKLSYNELCIKADYLASQLLAHEHYKKGTFVGLVCRRSIEMLIGIYGILKAGMAYLPISPELPEERIRFMLKDSSIEILVYTSNLNGIVESLGKGENIVIDKNENIKVNRYVNLATPADKAYIIYTSGTTGTPKGVPITHASLLNLTSWIKEYFKMDVTSKMLQQFAFIFDGSVFEIFPPGIVGGELVIITDDVKSDAKSFIEYLPGKILIITPSAFKILLECAKDHNKVSLISELKNVGTAGEVLTNDIARQYLEMTDKKRNLSNLYGPTETTVCATAYSVKGDEYGSIPIGKAIGNMNAYVLQGSRLCGIGMPGELCIGGIGVTEGYLNRKDLTSEKFIFNPHSDGEIIYRTGDLVKWDFDDELRYIGRIDEQVKIRGFRIELGEIQNRLCDVEQIVDAIVVAREINGEMAICAYFTAGTDISIDDVRAELKCNLPEYMVPQYFTLLNQIPHTSNGKVDKRSLPEPVVTTREYKEPETKTEKHIADAFSDILDIKRISRNDNFFDLGGHSLKATRLVNKLMADYGIKIPLSVILKMQTVEKIAMYIENTQSSQTNNKDEMLIMEIAEEEVFI